MIVASPEIKLNSRHIKSILPFVGYPSPIMPTTPMPDTPESPAPENRGQSDIFRPYDILNQPSPIFLNNPPNITTVADGLRN